MNFTYAAYEKLIMLLKEHDYQIANYHNHNSLKRAAILRHDVDYSLEDSLKMAEFERSIEEGVSSTYFVLLSSDFYNIASAEGKRIARDIHALGHEIGLHFDEALYDYETLDIVECIRKEANIMEQILEVPISTVSMHRPSPRTLQADLRIPGMINAYGSLFFNEFKYLSDSRRHWREDVKGIIEKGRYDKLQILTHAFWYKKEAETLESTVKTFVNHANFDRYKRLIHNIKDLGAIMAEEEIVGKE